jgi:tetratricopeptide (TPR) repeat protein
MIGRIEESIATAHQALENSNAFPAGRVFALANITNGNLILGRFPEAIEHSAALFAQARSGPCFGGDQMWLGVAHSILANLNLQRGWLDEAETQASAGLRELPSEVRTLPIATNAASVCNAVKAAARLQQEQFDEALKYARRAVRAKPKWSSGAFAHAILGAALLAKGEVTEAETECRRALELQAQSLPALYWMGRVLQEQGREADARASWESILALASEGPHVSLARTALGLEETNSAEKPVSSHIATESWDEWFPETTPAPPPVDPLAGSATLIPPAAISEAQPLWGTPPDDTPSRS